VWRYAEKLEFLPRKGNFAGPQRQSAAFSVALGRIAADVLAGSGR
jgi:hypothetical protein